MNPKISVIIPTYNRPHLIARAIKSVLNQTYKNFEIVVIDNNLDKKTKEVIDKFNDKRIIYIHNTENTNAPASRNLGVKKSSFDSKYISFLDDDDEFFPKFFEKTIAVLEGDKSISLVTTEWELRSRNGKKIRNDKYSKNFWEIPVSSGWVIDKNIFLKEDFWFDEKLKFMEDFDFGLRILKEHKWKFISEVLRVYYIIPLQNDSSVSSNLSIEAVKSFYNKNYEFFKKYGNKSLAYFYFTMGKAFMRAKEYKMGRKNFINASKSDFLLVYFLYYFLSFFPGIFSNPKIRFLKQKIFRGKI
jgi:glycosyltransferase involved in cell wall biosynthesis